MSTILLDACPTEDSTNCFWDGSHSGNGVGTSFWNYEGTTTYFDVPEGATPLGVWITDDGTENYAQGPSWTVDFLWPEAPSETSDEITTTTTSTQQNDVTTMLAETGPNDLTIAIVGAVFIISFGVWCMTKARRTK